jgi:hypothetical protein
LIAWAKARLTNSWMLDVQYLAAMAHSGWAALIVLSAARFLDLKLTAGVSGGLVAFAAVKEFVYDANFEVPRQTSKDDWEDFLGYLAGIALAWAVIGLSG